MQLHSLQLVSVPQPLGDYFAVYGQAAAMLNFDVLSLEQLMDRRCSVKQSRRAGCC